ncbi:aminoglycoside phosphotransferase family protein [Nonomuraea sp. NPDC003707]
MTTSLRTSNPRLEIVKGIARVGSHVVREGLSRRESADIPVSGKEVTREWLTAVICAGIPGAAVESFTTRNVSSGTSSRWRITIDYNDAGRRAGLPSVLFAKSTAGFKQRLVLSLASILEGEPNFYRHLRPDLGIEAARGYYGAVDLQSGRSISLMEDIVATKGATFCSPQTPISREQIEDLLANMAAWHGHYWNARGLAGHVWLKLPSSHFGNLDRLIGMEKRAKVGARRARSVLPEAIVSQQDTLYRALERSLDVASQGPLTLLHGDSHIGNTYMTADGRMGFTDWQVVMRGTWAYDFTYTVASGLTVENRRAWERDLLAFYLDRLAAAGGEAPAPDDAWLAYRQQAFYPYFVWLTTIGHSVIQPKYQPDEISLGIIERTANAVLDLDSRSAVNARG